MRRDFCCRASDPRGFLKLLFDKRPSATVKREACRTCNSCSGRNDFGNLDQDVDQGSFFRHGVHEGRVIAENVDRGLPQSWPRSEVVVFLWRCSAARRIPNEAIDCNSFSGWFLRGNVRFSQCVLSLAVWWMVGSWLRWLLQRRLCSLCSSDGLLRRGLCSDGLLCSVLL